MTNEERSEAGRRLSGFRKRKAKACSVCGTSFETVGRGVYCSVACKLKAWRQKRRQGAARTGEEG